MTEKLYGFYSRKMALRIGVVFYHTPDGREVAVTCVDRDKDGKIYGPEDKVCVGEVTTPVRLTDTTGTFLQKRSPSDI